MTPNHSSTRDTSAHAHPTAKPAQLRRDEVHFVVIGDDLHEQIDEATENAAGGALSDYLEDLGLDFDEVAVEHGREDA